MKYISQPEYWLRGPVIHIPTLLQPVAHALLQARAEANIGMFDFPENKLWARPAEVAAPGFHLQHIPGVIDRLFKYAREESLNETQMEWLKEEGENQTASVQELLGKLDKQVDLALDQLMSIDPNTLTDTRYAGRKRIPSTVIGLLSHAAEHSMRHVGQLLVTVRVLKQE